MIEKHVTGQMYPSSDQEFKCTKCQKLVKRTDYVHDDKICHECFEKAQMAEESVEPQ